MWVVMSLPSGWFSMGTKGFDRLIQKVTRIRNAVRDVPQKAAADWVEEDFKPAAQAIVPYDTGTLHDSIDGRVTKTRVVVFADAPHARYVEEGTSVAPAQPFMGPAFDQTKAALKQRIRAEIQKVAR